MVFWLSFPLFKRLWPAVDSTNPSHQPHPSRFAGHDGKYNPSKLLLCSFQMSVLLTLRRSPDTLWRKLVLAAWSYNLISFSYYQKLMSMDEVWNEHRPLNQELHLQAYRNRWDESSLQPVLDQPWGFPTSFKCPERPPKKCAWKIRILLWWLLLMRRSSSSTWTFIQTSVSWYQKESVTTITGDEGLFLASICLTCQTSKDP